MLIVSFKIPLMKNKELYGNLLVLGTTFIYGFNTPILKTLLPEWMDAWAITTVRQAAAAGLFWITALFIPSQKIPGKDLFYIALGALFGLALNQVPYALGLTISSPVDASILRSFTPVVVIILGAVFLHNKVSLRLMISVLIGISGAVLIILFGGNTSARSGHLAGNLLILLGIVCFSVYLVLIKPIAMKYNPVHVMKWMFLFAALMTFPFSYTHILEAKIFTSDANWSAILRLSYVIIFATYIAYQVNVLALKYISSARESLYSYLQPVIATSVAIMLGQDKLDIVDPVSLGLIFLSFYLVNRQKKQEKSAPQ